MPSDSLRSSSARLLRVPLRPVRARPSPASALPRALVSGPVQEPSSVCSTRPPSLPLHSPPLSRRGGSPPPGSPAPIPLRLNPWFLRSGPPARALVLTPHAARCKGGACATNAYPNAAKRHPLASRSSWIESMLQRIATIILILLMFLRSDSLEHRRIRPAMLQRIVQSGPWYPGESAGIGQPSASPHPAQSTEAARSRRRPVNHRPRFHARRPNEPSIGGQIPSPQGR